MKQTTHHLTSHLGKFFVTEAY